MYLYAWPIGDLNRFHSTFFSAVSAGFIVDNLNGKRDNSYIYFYSKVTHKEYKRRKVSITIIRTKVSDFSIGGLYNINSPRFIFSSPCFRTA